mgnify:CR=1 FL=1
MREKLSYPVRIIISLLSIFLWSFPAEGQDSESLKKQLDQKLNSFARQYVSSRTIKIDSILMQKKKVTLFANEALEDIPFREYNVSELYASIAPLFPNASKIVILTRGTDIESLIPEYDRKGRPNKKRLYSIKESKYPLTRSLSSPHEIKNGLQNRHIALWQSHGLYYAQTAHRWEWQRARMFGTVEDLFTQSFVLPYLTPMLENAGATILIPRERDTQIYEIIIDNDRSTPGSEYKELDGEKAWSDGEKAGFGHIQATYTNGENPFTQGTYRQTVTQRKGKESLIEWIPEIPESGNYAVYASYQSFPNSTEQALYTIHHAGGETTIAVNQTMGGGTWIYLGNFKFTAHEQAHERIVLTNQSNKSGKIITADAIKIGGGMGNIARSPLESPYPIEAETSGYPRFTEAARYWLQWAGFPEKVYSPSQGKNDYTDDYKCRGEWVNYLAGGSDILPDSSGLNVPLDLAFAFHSDAGTTKNDSIIGSLGIYFTGKGRKTYGENTPRQVSRYLTDVVLTQIADDIRETHEPEWNRRGMWNKSYFEARVPEVPTMLLELLSHQNFADMRYGLDPRFRFLVSRAIYKGILKFIAEQNDYEYQVQPLPVNHLRTEFIGTHEIKLTWRAVEDPLEPTAPPEKYIVYTRIGNGAFDSGTLVSDTSYTKSIIHDSIYSFKVTAVNSGGESFPSETVSLCRCSQEKGTVMVINGFDRISAPDSFEIDTLMAGFDTRKDFGVPYLYDISFIGEQYEFRRNIPWIDDDAPGFGASRADYETRIIAGNTFDYPYIHGRAITNAGYSFLSASDEAVTDQLVALNDYRIVDLILGKEKQVKIGRGVTDRAFKTFPESLQTIIADYCENGGNIFVSGAYVATDLWDNGDVNETDKRFANEILHYTWRTGQASVSGQVKPAASPFPAFDTLHVEYHNTLNENCYAVESPDGIEPFGKGSYTIQRYGENNIGAGIFYRGQRYNTCILGYPFETIKTEKQRNELMNAILSSFDQTITHQ